MKKTRVILALLLALLVLGGLFMAVADEGQGSMDVSPGDDEPPAETDPTEPPETDPTEPPVTDPTDTPSTDPTDEPGPTDEPTDEPGPSGDPTDEPTDEPTAEPTEEPTPEPPANNNTGGGNSGGGDQSSASRPSSNAGGGIRQPSTSSRRPTGGSSSGGSSPAAGASGQAPVEDGPQYVTFARVTQKSNSMSRTLFYSGAVCVGTGLLGLGVLAVFMVRGRRADGREDIIAEIEQASVRRPIRPAPQGRYEDDVYEEEGPRERRPSGQRRAQTGPAPSLHRPEPEELAVPVNGSLYTEEFELPPQQAVPQPPRAAEPIVPAEVSMYTEEFEPPRQAFTGRSAPRPPRNSVYPEEISLADDMARPAAPRQVRRQPEQRPRPRPASQVPPDQMDTSELLREILHGDDK